MVKRSALLMILVATLLVALAYGVLTACDGDSCDSTECDTSCVGQGFSGGVCYGADCECLGEADGDADGDASVDGGDAGDGGDAEADGPVEPPDECEAAGIICEEGQGCRNMMCVDPVADRVGYATQAGTRPSSYFWTLQLPALFADAEGEPVVTPCCIDLVDGDGVVGNTDGVLDNAFGTLISMMGSGVMGGDGEGSPQASVDAGIQAGTMTWIVDWTELPSGDGDARFSIFIGSSEDDWETRRAGTGSFLLDPDSFDDYGAIFQFNQAAISGGHLSAGPSTFGLALPLSPDGGLVEVALHHGRIEADITVSGDGVSTVDGPLDGVATPAVIGGGSLGGLISSDDLLGALDDTFRQCTCAGINPMAPVIEWGPNEDGDGLEVACNPDNTGDGGESCSAEQGLCGGLSELCPMMGVFAAFFDADYDGDGIKDSMTVGLRFGWVGATVSGLGS